MRKLSLAAFVVLCGLVAVAMPACDDTDAVDGVRGRCASGGFLNDCPTIELTPEAACTRMVECGSIPLDAPDNNFDWGRCVDRIDGLDADRVDFVLACIATSTCDALRTNGSPNNPYDRIACFEFGDE